MTLAAEHRKRSYKPRRTYTPEFRAKAIALCLQGTQTLTAVATDLGLHVSLLHNWMRLYRGEPAPRGPKPDAGLAALVEQLRPENLDKFHKGKPKKAKEETALVVAPRPPEQALAQMPLPILEEEDTEPCQRLKRVAVRSGLSMDELVNSLMELAMVEGVRRR